MTRVGSQRHRKKKLHLVGSFHSYITTHGLKNAMTGLQLASFGAFNVHKTIVR